MINDLVNQAIVKYAAIAKLDPNCWGDNETIELLNTSREKDASGVTTFMLVRGLVDHYLDETVFSARRVILEPHSFDQDIANIKDLLAVVEHEKALEVVDEFRHMVRQMGRLLLCRDEVALNAFLGDKWALASIRMASLNSFDKLRAFQFTQGEPDTTSMLVNPTIYEFWNINSLIKTLSAQQVQGVTMCLIRDPEQVFASYFVFAIRNGENLTVLTDKSPVPHPDYWRVTRKPDRSFQRRMEQHWFPYSLLDLEERVDENGNFVEFIPPTTRTLVSYQTSAIMRGKVGELAPEEFVWAGLVMERIRDEYGKKDKQLPELSYTTEMIVRPNVLVSTESRLMTTGLYKPLDLEPLDAGSITKSVMELQVQDSHRFNQWMEERYLKDVPSDVLNVIGCDQLSDIRNKAVLVFLDKEDRDRMEFFKRTPNWFSTLSPVEFGSKEEIDKDRIWIARKNAVRYIEHFAQKEFEEKRGEVHQWYSERVLANSDFILEHVAKESLDLPMPDWFNAGGFNPSAKRSMWIYDAEEHGAHTYEEDLWDHGATGVTVFKGHGQNKARKRPCFIKKEINGSYLVSIKPNSPEALAILAGVTVDELPIFLRHWCSDEPYVGNSILDRLDPLDGRDVNPWIKGFTGRVIVYLSKRGWGELRKGYGLPNVPPTIAS